MHIKRMLLILTLCLLVALPVVAQDATAEATAEPVTTTAVATETVEPPPGLPLLVLLMGLGAVVIVGGIAVLRQRAGEPED